MAPPETYRVFLFGEGETMATTEDRLPGVLGHRAWVMVGGILLLVIVAMLFSGLASKRLRHDLQNGAPPAGSVSGVPAPVVH
jgi:hypothetical protein